MLRINGRNLNVDALLKSTSLTERNSATTVYRRGEPFLPRTQPNGRRQYSGVNICISDAGFREFGKQIKHAIKSLQKNRRLLKRLISFKGVDGAVLDFGIAYREGFAQFDHLPAQLINLAGELGLAIEISHYPVSKPSANSCKRS